MNDRETPNTSPALEQIRDQGDVLDAARLYKKRRALGRAARWQVLGPIVPLSGMGLSSGIDTLFTYPLYAAGLGVAAFGSHQLSNYRMRRNVAHAEARQESIRDQLGEPVDVIRTHQSNGILKRNDHELSLRWYGADGTEEPKDRRDVKQRLERIANYGETENIENIIIGADWLKGTIGDEICETEFGKLCEGASVITDSKKLRVNIMDHAVDQRVLVSTPEQLRSLLEKIDVEDDENQINWLVTLTKNEVVARAHTSMRANQLTPAEFNSIVRTALERAYEEDNPASLRAVKSAEGVPGRIKVVPTVSVRNNHLHQSVGWNDEHTGDARISHDGVSDLLQDNGVKTMRELLDKLSGDENVNEKSVLSALYLLLRENDPATHQTRTTNSHSSTTHQQSGDTLFKRMHDEGRLTSPIHRASRESDGDFERRYRRKFATRALGATGVIMLSIGIGAGAGVGTEQFSMQVYNDSRIGFDEYLDQQTKDSQEELTSENFDKLADKFLREQGKDFDRHYLNAYTAVTDKDFDLSMYVAQKYVDIVGVDSFSSSMAGYLSDDWRSKAIKRMPPEMYTAEYGESFIGDAGVDKNQTIYTIDSLKGETTAGYWYGMISNSVSPDQTGLKFKGLNNGMLSAAEGEVDGPTRVQLPADMASINALNPDFLVKTPYLLGENASFAEAPISLPTMQGTEIVGLRISDQSDPSKFIGATIDDYKRSGISLLNIDQKAVFDAGIKNPLLEYWVKHAPDAKPTIHHIGGMSSADVDMGAVASTVKKALNLPANATDAQLLSAIRNSKYYSFTPFADEHKQLKVDVSRSPTEAMSEIGATIAQLDSLNCNLASALYLLGEGQHQGGVHPDLATGFRDDGDKKLTGREAHAWLIDENNKIIDPTPGKSLQPLPGMAPDEDTAPKPSRETSSDITNTVGEATLGAALMLAAYRRRKQLAQQATNHVLTMKNTPEAIGTIQTALYGGQGAKVITPDFMSLAEARKAVVRNVPSDENKRGIPLGEVKDLLREKGIEDKLSLRTQIAIHALYLSNKAIRASAGAKSPRTGRK